MTEQQILELITQDGICVTQATPDELVQAYAKQLARIADQIHCQDFVSLLAIAALLYKMSQGHRAADRVKLMSGESLHW